MGGERGGLQGVGTAPNVTSALREGVGRRPVPYGLVDRPSWVMTPLRTGSNPIRIWVFTYWVG